MVTLVNLKKVNNIVEYDYFDLDKENKGHVVYDIEKGKAVEVKYCIEDENSYLKTCFKKSLIAVKNMIEHNTFLEKYEYMWY